jgi:hypothetical protein
VLPDGYGRLFVLLFFLAGFKVVTDFVDKLQVALENLAERKAAISSNKLRWFKIA